MNEEIQNYKKGWNQIETAWCMLITLVKLTEANEYIGKSKLGVDEWIGLHYLLHNIADQIEKAVYGLIPDPDDFAKYYTS